MLVDYLCHKLLSTYRVRSRKEVGSVNIRVQASLAIVCTVYLSNKLAYSGEQWYNAFHFFKCSMVEHIKCVTLLAFSQILGQTDNVTQTLQLTVRDVFTTKKFYSNRPRMTSLTCSIV